MSSVVVDKTVVTLDATGSPDQFAESVAKLTEEHPELMKNANIELGEHVTGVRSKLRQNFLFSYSLKTNLPLELFIA